MLNRFIAQMAYVMLMAPEGGGEGGGGAGGGTGGQGGQGGGAGSGGNAGGGTSDTAKLIEALTNQNKTLEARLAKLEGGGQGGGQGGKQDDPSLADKVRKDQEERDKKATDAKTLEAALRFEMSADQWAKDNEKLLPKSVAGILDQAKKETYANAIEKTNDIKVGVVSEFFTQQANVELLTESQKNALAEFKALTKNDKQAQVQAFWSQVFEPTFETLKKIKKAEALAKGHATPGNAEQAFQQKMINVSRKHYLKERK